MSSSTANVDTGVKKDLYQRVFRTRDYFVFDPFDPNSLAGWRLDANLRYQPIVPNEQGWLWSQTLGFWLGTWEGTIDREPAIWLRLYDEAGNLVPLPEEAAEQQGLERELQQGLEQGARSQLLRLLTLRFGIVPEDIETRLQSLNVNQLEELLEVALTVDAIAQFANHLP
ncbi:MAG TPA: DUF4351 domain-containing protein [Waterburya sp.]|jgi:hypothetical protein